MAYRNSLLNSLNIVHGGKILTIIIIIYVCLVAGSGWIVGAGFG